MSKEEFARVIDSFLGEMSAICASKSAEELRLLLGFEAELSEARELFLDKKATSNAILSAAFGLVDEFAHRAWDEVIEKSYAFYIDQYASGDRMNDSK